MKLRTLRIPEHIYEKVVERARLSRRSVNGQIVFELEMGVEFDDNIVEQRNGRIDDTRPNRRGAQADHR